MRVNRDDSFGWGLFLGIWFLLTLVSMTAALFEGAEKGGCKYKSIASYYPPRAIVCELVRDRWGAP